MIGNEGHDAGGTKPRTDANVTRLTVSDPDSQLRVLKILYEENAESYRYFLEWRHKILLRYFFMMGAAAILSKGVLDYQDRLPDYVFVLPLSVVAIGSLVSYGMDRRNAWVTGCATKIGANLESAMFDLTRIEGEARSGGPFYTKLCEREHVTFTYTNILKIVYLTTFSLGLIALLIIGARSVL